MSESQIARLARAMVIVLSLVTLYFAIYSSTTLVSLLLLGYAGVTQFFPGIVLGLYSNRVTKSAVFAGLLTGLLTLCFLMFSNHDPFLGINAGFFALCLNLAVTFVFIRVHSWPKKSAQPVDSHDASFDA